MHALRVRIASRGGSVATAALLLAACSSGEEGGGAAPARPAATIACAVGGAQAFEDACTVEHVRRPDAAVLVIRHPDGGFRRLELLADGRLAAADGADPAEVRREGDLLEITVGEDHYRIPAKLTGPVRTDDAAKS
jgi:hypothetical protein